jgi:hypothetical protein
MSKFWKMILAMFWKPKPIKPPKPPTPEAPEFFNVAGAQVDFKKLVVSCTITSGSLSPAGFFCDYRGQENWWPHDAHCCGHICMEWNYNGKTQREYWDGMSIGSPYTYVSLWHITDPTSPFAGRMPKTGNDVGMFFVSDDKTQRSNVWPCKWPL